MQIHSSTLRCRGRPSYGRARCKGPPQTGLVRAGPVPNDPFFKKPATCIDSGNARGMLLTETNYK